MGMEIVQPEGWKRPRGYSNGMSVEGARRLVFVAGQIAWDAEQRLVGTGDFAAQFRQALANVVAVLSAAGGAPAHLASVTIYVKDKRAYLAASKELGTIWRELLGAHYPALALVQVADLLEEGALVEIQAIAALP